MAALLLSTIIMIHSIVLMNAEIFLMLSFHINDKFTI